MAFLGTVEEIWRYPVSSLGGEPLSSVHIGEKGISGDRSWAIVDAETGQAAAPEKEERWRPAVFLASRLQGDIPEIGFADGTWVSVLEPDIDARLSAHFWFDVAVRPYDATGIKKPFDERIAVNRYEPSPLHLITTSSLDHLAGLTGSDAVHARRFRPTILLRTEGEAEFREKAWIGQRLQIGSELVTLASEETKRCGMTLIAQPGIPENADILRTVLRQNRRNFGIYGSIEAVGTVNLGDGVYLRDG